MSQKELLTRDQIPVERTWDTSTIFKSEEDFEASYIEVSERISSLLNFQNRLTESAQTLFEALELRNELILKYSHLAVYSHLNSDVDTANSHYQGLQTRTRNLGTSLSAALSFFEPELLDSNENLIKAYLKELPELAVYDFEFELLFRKRPHILSLKEETLLAKASQVLSSPATTFSILNNADLKFPTIVDENNQEVELSHGRYSRFMESQNRQVRHDAFKGMYSVYDQLQHTFASTLSSNVKHHNFKADVRGFKSARHSALFENTIDESVHDALVEAVNSRLPLLHRYVSLRKKALNLDELRMYDLYVPMIDDVDLKFTFEEARDLIIKALSVLGEDYVSILEKAFNDRWIDIEENKGKRSGAYSSGTYGTNPFILMNWQGTLDHVYTLAHELGHSVHSYYTRQHQPFIYGDYSIFLAEVASTTNENLLTDYLLKQYDDPKVQAYIINHFLDGVKGTIYRQTQFAEFEHLIHQADQNGIALTGEYLTKEYFEMNKKYYGPAMTYDVEIGYEWALIPHFYYNYYVYQYATGFSAASSLSQRILTLDENKITDYIDFLKSGSSDYPIDVLKKAGVDMNSAKPIKDTLEIFKKRLAELEQLLIK